MTDSRPDTDSTPSKPRGLWSLMGTPAERPAAPLDQKAETTESAKQPVAASENVDPVPSKQRGLWGMMGTAPTAASSPSVAATDSEDDHRDASKPPEVVEPNAGRRGLFAMMQRADEATIDLPTLPDIEDDAPGDESLGSMVGEFVEVPRQSRRILPPLPEDEDVEPAAVDVPDEPREVIDLAELEPPKYRAAQLQARRHCWTSLGTGVGAILASLLSLLPNFLVGLPATVLGFVAVIAGYLSLTGAGRRELSSGLRAMSLMGMLLGTVGIFIGPAFFASLGRNLRESTGPQVTRQHLTRINQGLDDYYRQHDAYPIGGTFARSDAGAIRGEHGWMTALLPFVGEAELYQRVDQAKPFDDAVNRNVMGHNVNVYFTAGGDRARIGEGFAVAHFAGVGGEIDDAKGLAHLGIFERDVAVKREELTDGLSNTLIVGELGGTYPPWGDPENWRKIGRGLNKDINGFGSYSGQGAMFLLADGSVKIYSNKTDPKLLEKMTTRDGADELAR